MLLGDLGAEVIRVQGSGHGVRQANSFKRLTCMVRSYVNAASRLGCATIDVMVLSNNEPAADGDQPVPLDKRYVTLGEHQRQPHDLLSQFLRRHGHPTSITSHTTRSTHRAAQAPE